MNNDCYYSGWCVGLTHDEELMVGCWENDSVYYYEKKQDGSGGKEYLL